MSNLLNTQNINVTAPAAAKSITGNSGTKRSIGPVEAPQQLPKYSISKALQEKDEFRQNVLYTNYQSQKKTSILPKAAVILAAICGFFMLKKKK